MQRADFDDPAGVWEQLATHGFCTMCPDVTRWACAQLVEDTHSFNVLGRRRPISIKNMVRALVPGKQAMLAETHTWIGWFSGPCTIKPAGLDERMRPTTSKRADEPSSRSAGFRTAASSVDKKFAFVKAL